MGMRGIITRLAAGVGLVALTACSTGPASPVISVIPQTRPEVMQPPEPVMIEPIVLTQTGDADLRLFYKRLENDLNVRGLLRTDGGGPDTRFTDSDLTRNFVRIALFDEYVVVNGALVARPTQAPLRKWAAPVRMNVEFGASVPADQRAKDRATVQSYAARLARVSGHAIAASASNPNFHVLILNEADRLGAAPRIRQLMPGIEESSVRAIIGMPRDQLCIVVSAPARGSENLSKAVAVIRGEHPDLLRKSCIHEELAQGLGLSNDSPAARPSIFNDNEEFAFLTTHDELLLRMLYDPRLQSGMTAEQAAPIARRIATELLGGSAS